MVPVDPTTAMSQEAALTAVEEDLVVVDTSPVDAGGYVSVPVLLSDFGSLSPEINSGRIYAGPGSGPVLAAAGSLGCAGHRVGRHRMWIQLRDHPIDELAVVGARRRGHAYRGHAVRLLVDHDGHARRTGRHAGQGRRGGL